MAKKIKIRRRWRINPKTRVKESKKVYSRKRTKEELRKEAEERELERYL